MPVLISASPFANRPRTTADYQTRGAWPANWVACPDAPATPPFVTAYRRLFSVNEDRTIRVHVSADERYELFLDGYRIDRGPERGTPDSWFFETYDLPLAKGPHSIVARVWSLGDLAPIAQLSIFPGFLLATDDEFLPLLATGVAPWEAKRLGGYSFHSPGHAFGIQPPRTSPGVDGGSTSTIA